MFANPPRFSVRIRTLLLAFAAACMVPVLAAALHVIAQEERVALREAREQLDHRNELKTATLLQFVTGIEQILITASHTAIDLMHNPGPCNAYLRTLGEHFSQFADITVDDAAGNILCGATSRGSANVADRSYFQRAVNSGFFSVGEYTTGRLTGRRALTAALPVYKDADLRAVMHVMIDLNALRQRLSMGIGSPYADDVLLDSGGVVLASSNADLGVRGQPISDGFLWEIAQKLEPGGHSSGAVDGRLYSVRAFKPERGLGVLIVASVRPTDSVRISAHREFGLLIGVLIAVLIVGGVLAWSMAEGLVGTPMRRVMEQLKAVEEERPLPAERNEHLWHIEELAQLELGLGQVAATLTKRLRQRDDAMEVITRSEAQLRAQFESSPQPMWVYDEETLKFLQVNEAAVAHYGYSRGEFLAMTLKEIRPAEDVPEALKLFEEARGRVQYDSSARHRTKNGRVLNVHIASHGIEWDGRKARAVIAYDVTDRVEAERLQRRLTETLEELVHQRTAELEQANRELEAFSYSVSHDLRAPLAAIQSFCSVLTRKFGPLLPPQGSHYLDRISIGARQMDMLIMDLLSLSRVGREPLQLRRVDLAMLARDVVSRLRERFPSRAVAVTIDESLPCWADGRLMTIVLENLIGNAWKFTSRTEHAQITVTSAPAAAGRTTLVVADNGAGFDPAYTQNLFEPFRRLHSISEFEGTGIGLAIVRRIVLRLGGQVWAESQVGQGARFYVSMPDGSGTQPAAEQ